MSFFKKTKVENEENAAKLIIITGCAGAGKTTIGMELAKRLRYAYVDKDTVTRDYTDFALKSLGSFEGDRESELYKKEILPIEYKVTFKVCCEILAVGRSVVLTIPFIGQITDYQKWENIRNEAHIGEDIPVKFIWIKHDIDTEKSNIRNRAAKRDEYKLSHWEEYAKSVDGIEPDEKYKAYIYVNDRETRLSDTLEEVEKWINK